MMNRGAQESRESRADDKFEFMSERERQPTRGEWRVPVGGEETSAVFEPATGGAAWDVVFVFAHGAGGNMNDRGVLQTANVLRARGFGVVRFNFLYKEKKSSRPDAMPKLMETVVAVVERVREELGLRKSRSLEGVYPERSRGARDDKVGGAPTGARQATE